MCGIAILFPFGFGFEKNQFGMSLVWFEKLCSDILFNLQQILQRYCAVLNELCIPDFDTVVLNFDVTHNKDNN